MAIDVARFSPPEDERNALKLDETTSTERLLDLIRNGSGASVEERPPLTVKQGPPEKNHRMKRSLFAIKSAQKNICAGVDIGHERLRLVKLMKADPGSHAEYKSVPLPPGEEKGSDRFRDFLSAELISFCGSAETELWTLMPSDRVEVRQIRIPKVPDSQLEQVVYWTLKKEASFDEKEYFFDYEVTGESVELGTPKLRLTCYTAPIGDVEKIRGLFSETGFPLTGISIAPFVVQNIFRADRMHAEKSSACLYIGTEFSRIDLYEGGRLVLTRDIKTGVNSMIELLTEALRDRLGNSGLPDQDPARKILFALGHAENGPVVLEDGFSIGREEAHRIISPALERLVRQVERTIDHFARQLGNERVERIHVSGAMPVYDAMVGYFGEQLGVETGVFDPRGLAVQEEDPSERMAYIPALGLALSDNAHTPNFLFTYKDKKKKAVVERWNRLTLAAFLAIVVVCSGVYISQLKSASQKKGELAQLERLLQQEPAVSREEILNLASGKKQEQGRMKELGKRYAGAAVLGELSALTPEIISLTRVYYGPGDGAAKVRGKAEATQAEIWSRAHVEGTVSGEPGMLDTLLASYVMKLSASPMFSEVTVAQGSADARGRGGLLAFSLNAKIGPGK